MNNFPQQTSFPIIKKIKEYFFDQSKSYLEVPLNKDSFEESEDIIKVKKDTELKLKKILVDEMGISNFIGNSILLNIAILYIKIDFISKWNYQVNLIKSYSNIIYLLKINFIL